MLGMARKAFDAVVRNPLKKIGCVAALASISACSPSIPTESRTRSITVFENPEKDLNATSRNLKIAQDITEQLCTGVVSFDPNCGWAQANEAYAAYKQLILVLGDTPHELATEDVLTQSCDPLKKVSLRVIYGVRSDDYVNGLASKYAEDPRRWQKHREACWSVGNMYVDVINPIMAGPAVR